MKRNQFGFLRYAAIMLLCFNAMLNGQELAQKERNMSHVEEFSIQGGTLIEKEFIDVGKFNKCKIQVAKFTDLVTGKNTSGLRFEYEVSGKYSVDSKIAFLDIDEVDALITSLGLINEKVLPTRSTNYKEVSYTSRSGFQAGCYLQDNFEWKMFLKIEKYDSESYIWFAPSFLSDLSDILIKAKQSLK